MEDEYTLTDTNGLEPTDLGGLIWESTFDFVHVIGSLVCVFFFRLKEAQANSIAASKSRTNLQLT
jgi:hypothetical protein